MRVWQIVSVAFAWSSSSETGLPTIMLRPTTTARAPEVRIRYSSRSAMIPSGVAPTCRRRPIRRSPALCGVQAVDVLHRVDGGEELVLVEVRRQRCLDDHTVDAVVLVQAPDQRKHVLLRGVLGEPLVDRPDPDLLGVGVLEADVDLRRRVVPDEDRREPERAELDDLPRHLLAHLRGERFTVHERRGHGV